MNNLPSFHAGGGAARLIHRIRRHATHSAGIRWSSYVGDVRVWGNNMSKSYYHHRSSNGGSTTTVISPTPPTVDVGGVGVVVGGGVGVGGRRAVGAVGVRAAGGTTTTIGGIEHERLLVIGTGVAGCSAALNAARNGVRVTMLHAGSLPTDCNSYWAQGGIIYRNYDLRSTNTTMVEEGENDDDDDDGGDGGGIGSGRGGRKGKGRLVDDPRSLVEDIRVASGYRSTLMSNIRDGWECELEGVGAEVEGGAEEEEVAIANDDNDDVRKSKDDRDDRDDDVATTSVLGKKCPVSGVTWNEDAAWKLSLEGPRRVRQLLLGTIDGGDNHPDDGIDIDLDDASSIRRKAPRDDASVGCVVPFDRVTMPMRATTTADDDDGDDDAGGGGGATSSRSTSTSKKSSSTLSLCLEASHSAPRIVHVADRTGMAITDGMTSAALRHPLIDVVSDSIVVDLIYDDDDDDVNGVGGGIVIGARVLNGKTNLVYNAYATNGVVLASGGLCGIYEHTTNPGGHNALGSSAGLALRLEDRVLSVRSSSYSGGGGGGGGGGGVGTMGIVSDLEYVQFHPTALCVPNESRFLLTEALRGEGAILRDAHGRAFAADYHPRGELAPRDVVARAVYEECRKSRRDGGDDDDDDVVARHNAYLDITHRDPSWLVKRFPGVHAHLMSRSCPLDFTKDVVPITPAAHYTCGGVNTDLDGRVISVYGKEGGGGENATGRYYRNLYAAGEAARTGLHGGNRLASTSLLEGLVFGSSVGEIVSGNREEIAMTTDAARRAIERRLAHAFPMTYAPSSSQRSVVDETHLAIEASEIMARLRSVMWDDVGVARTHRGLERAVSELSAIRDEADRLWDVGGGTGGREVVALRDAAWAGLAVASAALSNPVSGGSHYLVASEEEEEEQRGRRGGGGAKELDSDDDEDDGLAVARA